MNVQTAPSALGSMSAEEWQIRCDLAALYRLVAHHRMTDWIYTHLSARIPGPEHHFLINQYGVLFDEMRASDLVKIDLDGNIIEEAHHAGMSARKVNAAGFCIHSAIHMARPDIMCVVHTHTAAGIAISAQKRGLLPMSQHALRFYGRMSYHGYEGIALDLDERDRLVHDLGTNRAMILRNHGLLVGGRTIPEAWSDLYYLERACQAQVAAGDGELILPPTEVCEHTAEAVRATRARSRIANGPGSRRCGRSTAARRITVADQSTSPRPATRWRPGRFRSTRRGGRGGGIWVPLVLAVSLGCILFGLATLKPQNLRRTTSRSTSASPATCCRPASTPNGRWGEAGKPGAYTAPLYPAFVAGVAALDGRLARSAACVRTAPWAGPRGVRRRAGMAGAAPGGTAGGHAGADLGIRRAPWAARGGRPGARCSPPGWARPNTPSTPAPR